MDGVVVAVRSVLQHTCRRPHRRQGNPPRDERDAFLTAVDNPAFYRALRTGLKISREKDTRPLQESGYDLVLVSTKQKWDQGQDVPSGKPIFIEVTIS